MERGFNPWKNFDNFDAATFLNKSNEALIKAHYNRVCRGNQRQQAKDEAILGGK